MMNKSQLLKRSNGNVALEFALALPVFFLLLSGVINYGLILANQNLVNGVASAGMLYAFGNSSTASLVKTTMDNSTTNLGPLTTHPLTTTATTFCKCLTGTTPIGAVPPTCSGTCTDGSAVPKYVTVTAQSQVDLIALDFTLANPFVTSAQGTIRTQR